jgi:polyisoprenoid-binding protein YceI
MRLAALLLITLLPTASLAAPASYRLEAEKSSVGFTYDFGGSATNGTMPVTRADLLLDFNNVAASSVAVTLDVLNANAGNTFATEAMKGETVLNAGIYPDIRFQSTKVTAQGDGARVEGMLTVRGVTHPIALDAQIYRQRGTLKGDLSHLSILLTGSLRRTDYGATGFSEMVGRDIALRILARVARLE